MSEAPIDMLYPDAQRALSDEALLALYSPSAAAPTVNSATSVRSSRSSPSTRSRRVRANMIASIDGSATVDGLSGGLGTAADRRVFDVLRQLADVVLVGAGTLRTEGYGAMRLGADAATWRRARGRAEHPALAIVSASLDLDTTSAVFVNAPTRPIVLTLAGSNRAARERLRGVADVVSCGSEAFEPRLALDALESRGFFEVLCEGGPSLLGTLLAANTIDELCLSVSPTIEGGVGQRVTQFDSASTLRRLRHLRLSHVLESDGLLITRYVRDNSTSVSA